MAKSFFELGERRSAKVNELFTKIARRYDLINDLQSFGLHRYWKKRVVEMAQVGPGERALDVCCGTGDIAFELACWGAEVVGLDFSQEMLRIAEARKSKVQSSKSEVQAGLGLSGTENLRFLSGDAQALPFTESSFDIVTMGYGLRNLTSYEAGLREMQRVAKPGGRILVLDFGKPDNALWRSLYFGYLRTFSPLLGLLFCGDASAYVYILESLKHYPAQKGVEAKMRELGLAKVQTVNFLGGVMSINYGERVE